MDDTGDQQQRIYEEANRRMWQEAGVSNALRAVADTNRNLNPQQMPPLTPEQRNG